MSVAVTGVLRPDEVPADVRAAAKQLADRKVMRFLDDVSTPPFLVAMRLLHSREALDPSAVGLFTVSSWESDVATPEGIVGSADAARVVRHYLEESNPTDWLRAMPNDALCQASIVGGIRGPNTHFVGGASALVHCLVTAERAVVDGAASAAIVVAFDRDPLSPVGCAAGVVLELDAPDGIADATALIDAIGHGGAVDELVRALARVGTAGVAVGNSADGDDG